MSEWFGFGLAVRPSATASAAGAATACAAPARGAAPEAAGTRAAAPRSAWSAARAAAAFVVAGTVAGPAAVAGRRLNLKVQGRGAALTFAFTFTPSQVSFLNCPAGPETAFSGCYARPHKSAVRNRFTLENAKGA